MKVLIVAKTRQGSGACIGGITFEGRASGSSRPTPRRTNAPAWSARWARSGGRRRPGRAYDPAPHREHHRPMQARCGAMSACMPFIEQRMPPVAGGPELLFAGLTQAAPSGALYIAAQSGIPSFSTAFWRPDQPLARVEDGKRIRYRYPAPEGIAPWSSLASRSRPSCSRRARCCASRWRTGGGLPNIPTLSGAVMSSYRVVLAKRSGSVGERRRRESGGWRERESGGRRVRGIGL